MRHKGKRNRNRRGREFHDSFVSFGATGRCNEVSTGELYSQAVRQATRYGSQAIDSFISGLDKILDAIF